MIFEGTPEEPTIPNYASTFHFGGEVYFQEGESNVDGGVEGMVMHADNVIYERSQDINGKSGTEIYAQHQGLTQRNNGLPPGSAVEGME